MLVTSSTTLVWTCLGFYCIFCCGCLDMFGCCRCWTVRSVSCTLFCLVALFSGLGGWACWLRCMVLGLDGCTSLLWSAGVVGIAAGILCWRFCLVWVLGVV